MPDFILLLCTLDDVSTVAGISDFARAMLGRVIWDALTSEEFRRETIDSESMLSLCRLSSMTARATKELTL